MFILDTNVVSELRKAKAGRADAKVVAWAVSVPAWSLYLSVISILELEVGVLLVERRDPAQGSLLRTWFADHVLPAFAERVLAVDTTVARTCAKLHVPNPRADRDALITATALAHGMTVVTRNVADFETLGAPILNPWANGTPNAPSSAANEAPSSG
jgi:predicted nucleic acid-binding protein